MTLTRDTYCSFCGTAYQTPLRYPRTCDGCKTQVWANPIPVSVVLQPVERAGRTGLLVVRRAIEPRKGLLALVGGFLEEHETWAEGGAREIREETGVLVDATKLTPFWFTSTAPRPNRVLLFSQAAPLDAASIGPFTPNAETSERGLVFGPGKLDEVFAFPLHTEAARRFFAERNLSGDHDYAPILRGSPRGAGGRGGVARLGPQGPCVKRVATLSCLRAPTRSGVRQPVGRHRRGQTMAHMWRVAFAGAIVAVTTLGACALKTDGTGAGPGPIGGQGTGGVPGEGGTGGGGAAEGGTGGTGTGAGEGGSGAGISGSGTGGNAGAGSGGMSGGGSSGGGSSGGGAGGSAGAGSAGASGTGGAAVCEGGKGGGNTNSITCENFQDCTGLEAPKCPPGGAPCEIDCSGDQSCFNATIDCNGSLDCTVRCGGYRSCRSAEILCGPGRCTVFCGANGPLDTTESCSSEGPGSGDTVLNCNGTAGDCTICGVNEPGVSIQNSQACTTNGCACGDVGECG